MDTASQTELGKLKPGQKFCFSNAMGHPSGGKCQVEMTKRPPSGVIPWKPEGSLDSAEVFALPSCKVFLA